jgi:hypothetical protein
MSPHLALRDELDSLDRIYFTSAFGVTAETPHNGEAAAGGQASKPVTNTATPRCRLRRRPALSWSAERCGTQILDKAKGFDERFQRSSLASPD